MAVEAHRGVTFELVEKAAEFLRRYYREELAQIAANGGDALYIEFADLVTFDPDFADDYLTHPKTLNETIEKAVDEVALPIDSPAVNVRITDERGHLYPQQVNELRAKQIGDFIAVRGQLDKVTGVGFRYEEAAFECGRCGALTRIPQSNRMKFSEPHECNGCERQGPWTVDKRESILVDQRKLKLKEPPGHRARGTGEDITVFAEEDLCHHGGENGLADHAGEQVVVLGRFAGRDKSQKTPEVEGYIVAESIVFTDPTVEEITVEETEAEFKRLAAGEEGDPVELLKQSITPGLEMVDQLDVALEAGVGWLFNGYRIEREDGQHVRGDGHLGYIGDPGTGKSTVMRALARIAPKGIMKSGGHISKVGLTAAAVQEEFAGKTEWTLEPGILPRANGGHALIDEVDEILDERSKAAHDALEGEQLVSVSKAGIHADLPTRCAVLIGGNPKEGRFNKYAPIADQLNMDPAFVSRIDVLLPLTDVLDKDRDRRMAETNVAAYRELSEAEAAERRGEEPPEADETKPPVPQQVFRDWVHYARNNVFPVLSDEASRLLVETYLDARNLNEGYEKNTSEDDPIPATIRVLESAIRYSTAYARVYLSETVTTAHVERAQTVLRKSIGLNFDKETGQFDADLTSEAVSKSQRDRIKTIKTLIEDLQSDYDTGVPYDEVYAHAEEAGLDRSKAEHEIEQLKQRGDLYEPDLGKTLRVSKG